MEFVDIAGLVRGASQGEGLGNKFLANIRETDAVCQVVRCFEDDDIVHVAGKVDPLDDIDVINLELALADIGQIEKRLERLRKGEFVGGLNLRTWNRHPAGVQRQLLLFIGRVLACMRLVKLPLPHHGGLHCANMLFFCQCQSAPPVHCSSLLLLENQVANESLAHPLQLAPVTDLLPPARRAETSQP
jgi:hypothetical protein